MRGPPSWTEIESRARGCGLHVDRGDLAVELWRVERDGQRMSLVVSLMRGEVSELADVAARGAVNGAVEAVSRATRQKDWNACPYESHANDCDCGGRGGDR